LAERAAWDFVANLPDSEKFDLVTLNPGFIVGPNLNKAKFTSGDMIKMVMFGQSKQMNATRLVAVDVRDVAKAHLNAVLFPVAKNKRYILCGKYMYVRDICGVIHSKYGDDY